MSWIQKLYETYDHCQALVGFEVNEKEVPLLPVNHTTNKAQVEIVIDGQGQFRRAVVVPKNQARTIIPCTEASGGRTSGEASHPLCDKLQYVAKDYAEFGGSKEPYFGSYVTQLSEWAKSSLSHEKIQAVLAYVEQGCLIRDLVSNGVLLVGPDGKLLKEWSKASKERPLIFNVLNEQDEAFVRWVVEIPGDLEPRTWRDETLWRSWIDYYGSTRSEKDLCYVTGDESIISVQHGAKLRNDGDKAKLISGNDSAGFTFRGHFLNSEQAATVGMEVSQKAHLALRWLISRQGYLNGDIAIVAWATSGKNIPQPTDDPISILGLDELSTDQTKEIPTAQELAIRLKKKIAGYNQELGDTADVVVMAVDSSTPGRLAITYYRELTGAEFLRRIDDWHASCAWLHRYFSIPVVSDTNGKTKRKPIPFIGAPSPKDIIEAAYGLRVDETLQKSTIQRILPCIIDGQQFPRDLVDCAVRRASSRYGKEYWEWDKALSIACALFRKFNRKENYLMVLDPERKTRDYLYGRLLALAESLEAWALSKANEDRETNAARLMQRFAEHPFSTWRTIELSLAPYKARLGGRSIKRQRMIDEVVASFQPDDFISDRPLSGEFLLGYHCQREDLRSKTDSGEQEEETVEE